MLEPYIPTAEQRQAAISHATRCIEVAESIAVIYLGALVEAMKDEDGFAEVEKAALCAAWDAKFPDNPMFDADKEHFGEMLAHILADEGYPDTCFVWRVAHQCDHLYLRLTSAPRD